MNGDFGDAEGSGVRAGLPTDWDRYDGGRDVRALLAATERGGGANTFVAARLRLLLDDSAEVTAQAAAAALLRAAVERGERVAERWAVAWLEALGDGYARLRWTTVAPEERLVQRVTADSVVTALARTDGSSPGCVIGTKNGTVSRWDDGRLRELGALGGPVRSVAEFGHVVLAGGTDGEWALFSPDRSVVGGAVPDDDSAAVTAVALAPDGQLALGTETGRVLAGTGPALPRTIADPRGCRVRTLAWRPDGELDVVWADGASGRWRRAGGWEPAEFPAAGSTGSTGSTGDVSAAAGLAGWLALAHLDGTVVLRGPGGAAARDFVRSGVRALAWSPRGQLAVCASDGQLELRTPSARYEPVGIIPADASSAVFLDETRLISSRQREVMLWDLIPPGIEDATTADERVTCVAADPHAPHRVTVATAGGRLRTYDGKGRVLETGHFRPGVVRQLVPVPESGGRSWLVAANSGLFRWLPGDPVAVQIGFGSCVGAGCFPDGRTVYAMGDAVYEGEETAGDSSRPRRLWAHPSSVTGFAAHPRHGIASLDYSGALMLGTPGGLTRTFPGHLPGHRILGWSDDGALLCLSGDIDGRRTLWRAMTDGTVAEVLAGLPSRVGVAVARDGTVATVLPGDGLSVIGADGAVIARHPAPGSVTGTVVGLAGTRILLGVGTEVEAYDVMPAPALAQASASGAYGEVVVRVREAAGDCRLSWDLPSSGGTTLGGGMLELLRESADSGEVTTLAKAAHWGQLLGEQVWAAGLAAALDRARGPRPHRTVRLRWDIPDSGSLHAVPWELLRDRGEGLLCFQEPPITTVRSLPDPPRLLSGRTGRPRMTFLIGDEPELAGIPAQMESLRRRMARDGVVSDRVNTRVSSSGQARQLLARHSDILHVWAHSGDDGLRLSRSEELVDPYQFAEWATAAGPPRLVVLVGCSSTLLARELIKAGAETVVAMRRTVMTGMVSVLIEDFSLRHAAGLAAEPAFTQALGAYVRTGHPGAAAVPVIYINPSASPNPTRSTP